MSLKSAGNGLNGPNRTSRKSISFWAGSHGIRAQVAAHQAQEELQYKIGRERILKEYARLKARSEQPEKSPDLPRR